ncbi:hypothetical protein [Caballeronia sp. LZ035]|uniref:hypothetical protein n=1 Tax=Caballeronia sp. LZ035 TaxID=3038568 RepID=UPI002855D2B9|nr:hypothetical protein [Caballeronia sp. LZ035]MDR5756368.1 hypothetical protein [Caballeronia sp. LZ035]
MTAGTIPRSTSFSSPASLRKAPDVLRTHASFENQDEKKARLGSRADKVWRSFSVNEKVCFGKQNTQYSDAPRTNYLHKTQTSLSDLSTIQLGKLFVASARQFVSFMRNANRLTP